MICIWSSLCHYHPIICCFIKIQNGSAFLVLAYPGCPEKEAVKWVLLLLLYLGCVTEELFNRYVFLESVLSRDFVFQPRQTRPVPYQLCFIGVGVGHIA